MKDVVDFNSIKRKNDLKNSVILLSLHQIFEDKGDRGIKKIAASLAQGATVLSKRFFKKGNITITDVVQILQNFDFFILCGKVESEIKNDNEIEIKICECQFEKKKILCNFTYNFLMEFLRLIFNKQMVTVTKKQLGVQNECCLNLKIRNFKHMEVLHLD